MSHHDAFYDDGPPIVQLQAAVKSLEAYVHAVVPPERPHPALSTPAHTGRAPLTPIQQFSRQELVAGKWKELGRTHVAVCGLGGMGAIAADALVRAGVGRMLLVDTERIRWSCMGQAGYLPEEVGFSRVQALRLRLQSIRAKIVGSNTARSGANDTDVTVDSYAVDWRSEADLSELRKKLKVSSVGTTVKPTTRQSLDTNDEEENGSGDLTESPGGTANANLGLGLFEALTQRRPYDVVLSCLEDDDARLALNQICLELSLPLLHVSLSPCNSRISIRTVLPGHTCCLQCIMDPQQHTSGSEPQHAPPNAMEHVAKSIAKAFPASLPHVELMAGGLLGQHTIKFLLQTGDFVPCFTVNALSFEMESFSFPVNPMCSNTTCRQRQDELQQNASMR